MRSVKKYKIIVPVVAVCLTIAVLLTVRMSLAYLMDAERKDNVITIGNVNLELTEDKDKNNSYEDSQVVAAGDSIIKAPALTNTGTEDEYVFLRVAVPIKKVTLLYEATETVTQNETTVTHNEGTKVHTDATLPENHELEEIYRMIATGDNATQVTATNAPNTEPCLSFGYNVGNTNTNGWIYLKRELNQELTFTYTDANGTKHSDGKDRFNVYYFGYNRRLQYNKDQTAQAKTVPLFDQVQLKSFIDEELIPTNAESKSNQDTYILVRAYGIQADSLDTTGKGELDTIARDAYLTQAQLEKIFGIVERKAGEP